MEQQVGLLINCQKRLEVEESKSFDFELRSLRNQLCELEINKMKSDQTLLNAKKEL
jgi:hypothetical protein